VQILEPCCNSSSCLDAKQAAASRLRVLGRAADEGELLVPAHFGGPAGALERFGGVQIADSILSLIT
jgi:hypothetical protein